MKKSLLYFALAVWVTLLVGMSVPAHAGWVAIDKSGDKNVISKGIVKNTSPNRSEWSLMDVNSGTLMVINDRDKVYTSGTAKEFCKTMSGMRNQMMSGGHGQMRAEMEKMMKGMDDAMKDMSPEQRQMMEQMMNRARGQGAGMPGMGRGRGQGPAVSVSKAGTGDVVAGFKTTHYKVSVGGRVAKEVWLTADSSLMNDIKPYMNKFLEMSREMKRCTSMGGMMGGPNVEGSEAFQSLMEKGFPLKEKDIRSGWTREVVKLEKKSIPDSEMKLPKGYKKVSFMELMQSQRMGRHR